MADQIDYRSIKAGIRRGRIERAIAFRRMAHALSSGLRNVTKMILAMVT